MITTAAVEVNARHPELSAGEANAIATEIAVGALRYFMLKYTKNSVIAFDLRTGEPRWSFRGAGPDARRLGCGAAPAAWCPPWENNFSVWDFAGSGANVFRARINGRWRDLVGIGQKSGVYWTFEARTGKLVWATLVGHGGDPGGIQWGSAVDDERIFAAIGHVGAGVARRRQGHREP